MKEYCSILDPWQDNNFAPCFREKYLNGFLLLLLAISFFTSLLIRTITHFKRTKNSHLHDPLNKTQLPGLGSYGTILNDNKTPRETYEDASSSNTSICFENNAFSNNKWSVYNYSRLTLSTIQLCLAIHIILATDGLEDIDLDIEGKYKDLISMYYSRLIFWGFNTILALFNIGLSFTDNGKPLEDTICYYLDILYSFDLLIQLINIYSYYQLHTFKTISERYENCLISCSVTLILLLIVMNESRHAPSKPIIADTGRVVSGEQWASTYSKLMFNWMNAMMKKGNKETLSDDDLIELPWENRAKNALLHYRMQKKASMVLNLLSAFKAPLSVQFLYCMCLSIMMFGPPYFLNKIIKFIEDGATEKVPVSSAFMYVLGMFLSTCGQSLAFQQTLAIGRTMSVRVQAVVIGEVYSKSLRRRDEYGASGSDGVPTSDAKPKTNVNNLLSVDAQKMGEMVAYIFNLYCFPIQIIICIWSLYKLLGPASLWGVFIICGTQPLTVFLSRRLRKRQQDAMSFTDNRISLMTELLSAIRIIKFFAWENQFRQRVHDAREAELKQVKSRLYYSMWIGNTWFLISTLTMVTVFYAYTRNHTLTASAAFTALALFNSLKTILNQLPFVTSFYLLANVSLGRIGKYLDEEEIELPVENYTSSTRIGFINNASFSWNSPSSNSEAVAHIRNLNVSFPLSQLSIVCGPTGSGKSTLLSSLLGETYCLSGAAILPRKKPTNKIVGGAESGIAYVAQTAWLQNCSIKDNILFGLLYEKERYENVLYMTALTRDLEYLEFGDSTEIGEKGITLSGGQKQRIAIARAVYSQADIVILDDCLSAVDAHTAKHLYQNCLMGPYMRERTVILVTHHVSLCIRGASYIVALDESGSVAAAGVPLDVIKTGVLGEISSEEEWTQETGANEEAAVEGPIPTVPKTVAAREQSDTSRTGKLVQDEKSSEGGVKWAVYRTYYHASGGFFFWIFILLLLCASQGSELGQNYWIQVWSAAYKNFQKTSSSSVASIGSGGHQGLANTVYNSCSYFVPQSAMDLSEDIQMRSAVDVGYYIGIYFLIGMFSLALTTVRSLVLFQKSLVASKNIHNQLLDRVLRAKVRFFDTTPLGRIVNRFSSDLGTIDQSVASSISSLMFSIIATSYVILLISTITPSFIIPGIIVALMFKSTGTYYLNTSRDLKRLNSVSRSPVYVQFNETITGVATIRAFGSQNRFLEENFKRIDDNNRPFLWMWVANRWLHCRIDVLGSLVCLIAGTVLVMSRDWINPGLAGLSLSCALTFTHNMIWVVRMYTNNEMNMNSIERVHEYLKLEEEPPVHIPETEPRASWPEAGVINVQNLVMQYAPDTPAILRGVSFQTKPREKIGIVGRTGSGKSTLALSIFRFMEPTSGSIQIDGIDIHKIGLEDLRSRLTIIPQDPVLFSGTLRSNLDPFNQYDDATLWAALRRSHLIDSQDQNDNSNSAQQSISSSVDSSTITLDSLVTENGNNWSQGQRQLIALSRALIKKTSLIILDEATSSVDFDTDHQIQETIRNEFANSSLLCIAHRIRTVADYDRILVLDNGEVKEFASPYELMTRDGSVFQQMCERSGEFPELLAIAKSKHDSVQVS